MTRACCVCSISTAEAKSQGVTFFKFPTKAAIREEWIAFVGNENFTPTKCSSICSRHFKSSSTYQTGSGGLVRTPDAIPTIKNPEPLGEVSSFAEKVMETDSKDEPGKAEDNEISERDDTENLCFNEFNFNFTKDELNSEVDGLKRLPDEQIDSNVSYILKSIRNKGEVTAFCQENEAIFNFARLIFIEKFAKNHDMKSIRTKIITHVRKIAQMYMRMKESALLEGKHMDFEDIVNPDYFYLMEQEIAKKYGMNASKRTWLGYTLRDLVRSFTQDKSVLVDSDVYENAQAFEELLQEKWYEVFSLSINPLKPVVSPEKLKNTLRLNIKRIDDYIDRQFIKLTRTKFLDAKDYFSLKTLAATKLTMLNSSRGISIGRITVKDVEDSLWLAFDHEYISKRLRELSTQCESLISNYKIIFHKCPETNDYVEVIVPESLVPILLVLMSPELRRLKNGNKENQYLFAHFENGKECRINGFRMIQTVYMICCKPKCHKRKDGLSANRMKELCLEYYTSSVRAEVRSHLTRNCLCPSDSFSKFSPCYFFV